MLLVKGGATGFQILGQDRIRKAVLRISPSTWYQWRQIGKSPKVYKLPNGQLRIRRSVFEDWLANLESETA